MNKVTTINLGGAAFQLEESGYDALRAYLESGAARLQGNPDREEILSDIERAIADKFRALLAGHKNVVEASEVASVLGAMGPIEAYSGTSDSAGAAAATSAPGSASGQGTPGGEGKAPPHATPRRLYRISEGEMFYGVCNGLAAYLNVDPTLIRLAFVLLVFFGGTGVLIYLVLGFVIPEAETAEEKAAATGFQPTAQEFIRRAKEGYYEAMKSFPDRKTRREWKRRFKWQARACWSYWPNWHWHSGWADPGPVHPGMGFVVPILSLLQGAVTVLCLCTLVSLLGTGALFGRALPGGVPEWLAVVSLLMAYTIVKAPLKAARRSCCAEFGSPRHTWPFVLFVDALVWLLVFVSLVWLAIHFLPQLQGALENLPTLAHQAAQDVRGWWKGN